MSVRDRASAALLRAGGLCMIAAGVMVVVPALCPTRPVTVLPPMDASRSVPSVSVLDPAAAALLARAATATRTKAWQGTQLVSVFGRTPMTAMVDVAHLPGVGSWTTMRRTASTSVPLAAHPTFEPEAVAGPAGQPTDWLSLVGAHYTVRSEGRQVTEGVLTDALLLQRSDGTAAARFFVSVDTALIVRREVYDLHGDPLRASAFSELALSSGAQLAQAGYSPATVADTVVTGERSLGLATLDAWRAAGWTVPSAIHRDFDLVDARSTGSGPRDPAAELHLTYSDGLSSVSLFAEHGRLDPGTLKGWHRSQRASWPVLELSDGHDQVTWSDGTLVWTVVADAPSAVVDGAVAALPHQRGRDGYGRRFSGGLSRIGSWINPFG